MCIIERQTRANHAEYGPIVAHMGPLFTEMGLKSGPISVPGGELGETTGRETAPAPIESPARLQGMIFMRPGGRTAGDALMLWCLVERRRLDSDHACGRIL